MGDILAGIRPSRARQQPGWRDAVAVQRVSDELRCRPALVRAEDVWTLRSLLGRVVHHDAQVVQAGDCAEDPAECGSGYIARKAGLLDLLAGAMRIATHHPVIRVGRIAGQFVKPRSKDTERVGDLELPVYRGHMVNGPEPDPDSRRPDPRRMLDCHDAAARAMRILGWHHNHDTEHAIGPRVWTSHEALLLDYEIPMLRRTADGRLFLASTHFPWIGERTNHVDGAHVALLAEVINPVAVKVGPRMTEEQLLALLDRLDPARQPGRLTLISRMGAGAVRDRLPALARAVRESGHPVSWLCDPMHGNTVTTPEGLKTRYLETIQREISDFQCAVNSAGGVAGGLHLETTPDAVTECVASAADVDRVGDKYTSLCDPRLNPEQAVSVLDAWRG